MAKCSVHLETELDDQTGACHWCHQDALLERAAKSGLERIPRIRAEIAELEKELGNAPGPKCLEELSELRVLAMRVDRHFHVWHALLQRTKRQERKGREYP